MVVYYTSLNLAQREQNSQNVCELGRWSIRLFDILCRRFVILLSIDRSFYLSGYLVFFVVALWFCCWLVSRLIDLSGYLVFFVFALWYFCRSIGQSIVLFGILFLCFVILLTIDRSVNRAIWYSLSSLCDIAFDRSIDRSIGLFGVICRSFLILLSINRSFGLFSILCLCLCFVILLAIGQSIDLSGYLIFFVVALWYCCRLIYLSVNRAVWYSLSLLCDIAVYQSMYRSIGLFGVLCPSFVILLAIGRSIYLAIWYSLPSLCDIADDQSIYRSIGLFGIFCRSFFILLSIDLSVILSGCLIFFVVALW